MDAAAVPWLVVGAVLLLLSALLAAPVARRRPRPAPAAPSPAVPPPRRSPFPDDDLPAFRTAPPGTPGVAPAGARPARTRVAPEPGPRDGTADGPSAGRVVLAMATAALALVAVLAVLAGVDSASRREPDRPSGGAPRSASEEQPVVELPAVPASPASGEPGAGALAALSVPLGADGWVARLSFGPLVLERRAVGTTVTSPGVSVTRGADGTALAHVRLPTWNCLTSAAPADPQAAGCSVGPVEYADLPSPALVTTVEDGVLRLSGRFPTYTRPHGGPPVYTGRVYELTVTLEAEEPADPGTWTPARGTLFLGTDRAESLADPGLSAVLRAG